jgi:hypothetical protein
MTRGQVRRFVLDVSTPVVLGGLALIAWAADTTAVAAAFFGAGLTRAIDVVREREARRAAAIASDLRGLDETRQLMLTVMATQDGKVTPFMGATVTNALLNHHADVVTDAETRWLQSWAAGGYRGGPVLVSQAFEPILARIGQREAVLRDR